MTVENKEQTLVVDYEDKHLTEEEVEAIMRAYRVLQQQMEGEE